MPRKKTETTETTDLLSPELVERRTAIARMRQLELSNEKEALVLEEKKRNVCRIDSALSAFDIFLADFVEMLVSLPDTIQGMVPGLLPTQYGQIQSFIDSQLQRLSQKRLYLAIESTAEASELATAAKVESQKKSTKMKKTGGR